MDVLDAMRGMRTVIRLAAAAVLVGIAIGAAARALHVRISGGARWP